MVKSIKDLIDRTILNEIVSVQYLAVDKINYFEGEIAKECFVVPTTRTFSCEVIPGTVHDEEFDYVLDLELKMQLERAVIRNLRNCAIRKEIKDSIISTAKENNCNWLISSPEITESISFKRYDSESFSSYLDVRKCGEIDNITVYQDPLFPITDILLGRRGKDDFGYVYSLREDSYKVSSDNKLSVKEHHKLIDANHYYLLKYGKNL